MTNSAVSMVHEDTNAAIKSRLNDCQGIKTSIGSPVLSYLTDYLCIPKVIRHETPVELIMTLAAPHPCHPLICDKMGNVDDTIRATGYSYY